MNDMRLDSRGACEALLKHRGLVRPDGRPLYEYRFSREEFERLGNALRHIGIRPLNETWGAALFVAFSAEWFRRERAGGAWDWIRPLAEIGVKYHPTDPTAHIRYSAVRDIAERGLDYWRRPHIKGRPLLAIVREAGFPAASLREGPMKAWLKRSVLAMEAGFSAEEAVALEAWRASETLTLALHEPAVQLTTAVVKIRERLRQTGSKEVADPIQRLNIIEPDWLKHLPFDLEERDLRLLVEDMLRIRKSDTGALTVTRFVHKKDGVWVPSARISLIGCLNQQKSPPVLRDALEIATRLRIFPGNNLRNFTRPIAVLERIDDNEEVAWEVRPLVQNYETLLPLSEEFRVSIVTGNTTINNITAFSGEPLLSPVLVLKPNQQTTPDAVAALEVIGSSPIKTRLPWLVLAIAKDFAGQIEFENTPIELGVFEDGNRRLAAFSGRATMIAGDTRLSFQTSSDRDDIKQLTLVGEVMRGTDEHIYVGLPKGWISNGEVNTAVKADELLWRSTHRDSWKSGEKNPPAGKVEFCAKKNGDLIAFTRANVVPVNFELECDPEKMILNIRNIAAGIITALGAKPLPCRIEGSTATIDLKDHQRGCAINLSIRWGTRLELTIPDPLSEITLIGADNKPIKKRTKVSINRLDGLRFSAPDSHRLQLEVRSTDTKISATQSVPAGTTPLQAFEDTFRSLLGSFLDLDSSVRLSWDDQGEYFAEIAWYDLDQDLTGGMHASPFHALSPLTGISISAISLANPASGIELNIGHMAQRALQEKLSKSLGNGPWLLLGKAKNGLTLRPKLLPALGNSVAPTPLETAIRNESRSSRDRLFNTLFREPDLLAPADIRTLISLCVSALNYKIPISAIDALRTIHRQPKIAASIIANCESAAERAAVLRIQYETPFLWSMTEVNHWVMAFQKRAAALYDKHSSAGLSVTDCTQFVANALLQIIDHEPALQMHVKATFLSLPNFTEAGADILSRFKRSTASSLPELVETFVRRQLSLSDTPPDLPLTNIQPSLKQLWDRYDPIFSGVILAPIIAAKIAAREIDVSDSLNKACRTAWLYDKEYFDTAFVKAMEDQAKLPSAYRSEK